MKKTYIIPNNRVHILSTRDGILDSVSLAGNGPTSDPTGGTGVNINSTTQQEETTGGSYSEELGRSGSTNIWSNEW